MACRRKIKWYIESKDGMRVLVESKNLGLIFTPKIFEADPKLYSSVKQARKVAEDNGAVVKRYGKRKYDLQRELPF